ncbi:interleukin-1 receptor accessory protein-like 1 isoform X2 [Patiria miniata]|uniref:Soluble interferon alpha/beta receptor OPG204 n=1 Tax=Patiria miniata TaxID=46514 RepID=A0A913ZFC3_PATMI|nr:interleukin-1 receptor accessory protein-like 1 isoform X2 [Patiria miniata]
MCCNLIFVVVNQNFPFLQFNNIFRTLWGVRVNIFTYSSSDLFCKQPSFVNCKSVIGSSQLITENCRNAFQSFSEFPEMNRAALFSLMVAMVIGSISANNKCNDAQTNGATATTAIPDIEVTLDQPDCKLYNVQEGLPFGFTSPQQISVVTVTFLNYVALDCSAQNYCRIRWFKDGAPFEMQNKVGLSHDNQTLEIQEAYYSRAGNYTCVVTNATDTIRRTTQLIVREEPWNKEPYPLSADSCANQTANIGDAAEFFCIFFAGDFSKDVQLTWYKWSVSGAWVPVSALYMRKTRYEERLDYSELRQYSGSGCKPTAGMRLNIRDVTEEAYGDYRLEGNNSYGTTHTEPLSLSAPPPKPRLDLTAVITASGLVALMLILGVVMALAWQFVKLDFKIWRKNRFGALEDDDGKTYDAFISYADEDLPFALNIRERLEQSGYSVCVGDIDFTPATTLVEEIILALNTSRRCMIIISPDFIRARHSAIQVDVAMEQMLHRQIKIVPVIYRDVSSVDCAELPVLKRILANVRRVTYDENAAAEKFTKQLLVHMPPHRPVLPPQRDGIEGRILLRGSVSSANGQVDGNMPGIQENARECEMNRFLKDVAEAGNKNPHAVQDQREIAVLC